MSDGREQAMIDHAEALRSLIVAAKIGGRLSKIESQRCFAALQKLVHILKGTASPEWRERDLPEYMDWPNERYPCPKCGDNKPRYRKWRRETAHAPERVDHVCFCDHSLTTKPLDATDADSHSALTGEETT